MVHAASYLPSGPLSTLLLGSGTTETRGFDGRYVPTSIALTGPVEKTFTYTTDEVGDILEIVEHAGCEPGPLLLENQTVTTQELFASCTTIEAGNGFAVESPGDVTLHAQGTIALKDGFAVGTGARFVAGSGALPELSRRSYGYQAPQYFLTSADGPWGELDWTYDKIGNRTSETRDGGSPDTYQYLTNGGGGNTPVLDLINLGVLGTRDYTWGSAGHLEEVNAAGNVIDFTGDAEGRLASTTRAVADVSASHSYDGRSFLTRTVEATGDPPTEAASVEPLYDSAGLVHALRRRPAPADPEDLVVFFYLAGRPVVQLTIDGTGTETWTYLTTDHLGTPLLATDETGIVTWESSLEPFGRDFQHGTAASALESGIFLRLPGQWDDTVWQDASSGAAVFYNVHRWYQLGVGRYTRLDPLGLYDGPNGYAYVAGNPMVRVDLLGLQILICSRDSYIPLIRGAANHAYFWDPQPETPEPRSCGRGPFSHREKGPLYDNCKTIPGSEGKEDFLMLCCESVRTVEPFVPFANDCQAALAACTEALGLGRPTAPGGRFGRPCDECPAAPPPTPPELVPPDEGIFPP